MKRLIVQCNPRFVELPLKCQQKLNLIDERGEGVEESKEGTGLTGKARRARVELRKRP